MSNIFGRQLVLPMVNKSGGALAAGDVVVVDTSNDTAVTTTTSAASTLPVGVVQETIASNGTGRVLFGGYAALVNVSASVTRGQYGATHTVAKQAAGTASRGAGTFVEWLTGGTTPSGFVYPTDLLGSSLTNPMTNVGDIIYGGTAGAPTRLADVATGSVLLSGGVNTAPSWGYPPATIVTQELGADQTTNNTSTWTDVTGLTGISLGSVGTWIAIVDIEHVSTGNYGPVFRLTDGTTTRAQMGYIENYLATVSTHQTMTAKPFVLSGATSLKLQYYTDTTMTIKQYPVRGGDTTSIATKVMAWRVV